MPVTGRQHWEASDLPVLDSRRLPDPVRILVFVEAITINGVARSLLNLLDGLSEINSTPRITHYLCSVATFCRGAADSGCRNTEFIATLQERGIPVHIIQERYRWDPRVFSSIRSIVAETTPHIIQTNHVKSNFLIRASGCHRKCRWVAFQHGYTATDFKVSCYNQLDRWTLRSADRVIAPCIAFTHKLYRFGVQRERVQVVRNAGRLIPGLAVEDRKRLREQFNFDSDSKVLLTVGRLSSEKGHIDLIQAMSRLRAIHPHIKWNLLLVGSGPEFPTLRAAVDSLGLSSAVTIATDVRDVIPLYGMADLFVLPSRSEGSPHVLLEAMGAGLPIVATSVGGVPEMLDSGETAILVPPLNPDHLASGILQMLESPKLAQDCVRKARGLLETKFSAQTHVKHLTSIYSEVLSG